MLREHYALAVASRLDFEIRYANQNAKTLRRHTRLDSARTNKICHMMDLF